MNFRKLTKKLRKLGCEQLRSTKSSHEEWINPATNTTASIPNHGLKDLKMGTIKSIERELKVDLDSV